LFGSFSPRLQEFSSLLERNDADGTLKGEVKSKLKHAESGLTFTDTYATSNDMVVKVEAPELFTGVKADLETTFNPYTAKKEVKIGSTFSGDSFLSTVTANVFSGPKVKFDTVFSHEGFVAGGQGTFDINSGISDYAVALGYSEADYAVTLHGNRKLSQFITSFNHVVSSTVSVAGQATWGSTEKNIAVEFGTQHKLGSDATLKTRFDTSGKVGFGYTQKLRPDVKASFGLLIDTRNHDQNAHKFGYSITFEPK